MQTPLFFPADAHEGPVWVTSQRRLYYTTSTHLKGRRRVDIEYLDFSAYLRDGHEWPDLPDKVQQTIRPQSFVKDANMANGMQLARDGFHLLVTEQGYENSPGGVAKYHLQTGQRAVLISAFAGTAFNSPNKAIESRAGHLIISDPDYAFRQGFRPPPELEPNVYLYPADGETPTLFRCGLEMPHGLALSPDEQSLFISDTSNDGAHRIEVELNRRRSVWRFGFDRETPKITGPGQCCFQVDEGIPDGMATTSEHLLVGGGDGVYVAGLNGNLLGKILLPEKAVNLTLAGNGQHLFVTSDVGVLLLRNWREQVGRQIEISGIDKTKLTKD